MKRKVAKYVALGAAALIVISLVFGVISWVTSWGGEAARITGPQNTREQYTEVIGDWQGLQRAAENACEAKDAQHNSDSPTLVEDPALAYRARYRSIEADYDRRMNNLFEAGIVGPHGYPRVSPTLADMQGRVC